MATPQVTIKTSTPRDRHTPTCRLVPFLTFPGMPIPGMPVDLIMPGTLRPVPGYVHSFDAGLGVVLVSPDYQMIHHT